MHDPLADPSTFRVLLTGFGPFSHHQINASWLAVKPLHDTLFFTETPSHPLNTSEGAPSSTTRAIHISALEIPVSYEAVLDIVPLLHLRPPVVPESISKFPSPPNGGYDFIFHIGVAGRGPLRMERLGHKLGYNMKDANGKLAAIVHSSSKGYNGVPEGVQMMQNMVKDQHGMDVADTAEDTVVRPTRGFGPGYEKFADEITTEIDVTRLVQELKQSGIEQVYSSMDAGHYLCDFIYYCSLAEAKRNAKLDEKRKTPHVLFLHCPPVNQPLSTEEVTDAIKRIIVWVCKESETINNTNEASGLLMIS
ncbi:hypothetical protein BDQ17DRAFT_1252589 [Cyathus striatus]|nr:hypothetical protein BDQ17DRAFT_1252589 [Cyathus striatus]